MARPVRTTAAPAWRRHYQPGEGRGPSKATRARWQAARGGAADTPKSALFNVRGGGGDAPRGRALRPNAPFTTGGVRRSIRRGVGLHPGEARASGHGGGCRMKRPVLLIALLTLTVVGAASIAQAEPGLQSKLTAISGQGTGHVEVSP